MLRGFRRRSRRNVVDISGGIKTMTPKERLKRLESYSVCDNYREKEEDFREIEKALEIYEILKKHVYFSVKSRCIRMGDIYKRTTSFDYEDLKEWLRNAK